MLNYSTTSPIVFIIFRRAERAQRIFDVIKQVKPKQLFVLADGARADRASEAQEVAQTRAILSQIDWDCDLKTNFSETNLGNGRRISSGLSWVFEQVDRAIILEDDCLPHISFFRFCDELLEKYKDDSRIGAIGGNNFQRGAIRNQHSYYFSRYPHIWGWATWKRTWACCDYNLSIAKQADFKKILSEALGNDPALIEYWQTHINLVSTGQVDTWDYQFTLSNWLHNRLAIAPNINLVSNIGFGADASNTKEADSHLANIPTHEMQFPLKHPEIFIRESVSDFITDRYLFGIIPQIQPLNLNTQSNLTLADLALAETKCQEGIDLLNQNRCKEALIKILEAISIAPNHKNFNLALGCSFAKAGLIGQAKIALRTEVNINPDNQSAAELLNSMGG